MEKFKLINATFKAIGKKSGKQIAITIKRELSGANAYGDRSSHSLKFGENMTEYFDTRYERISTNKDKWLKTWEEFLLENYLIKDLTLEDYEESEIELEEK